MPPLASAAQGGRARPATHTYICIWTYGFTPPVAEGIATLGVGGFGRVELVQVHIYGHMASCYPWPMGLPPLVAEQREGRASPGKYIWTNGFTPPVVEVIATLGGGALGGLS